MIESLISKAKHGEAVYISEVRDAFSSHDPVAVCVVEPALGAPKRFDIPVPRAGNEEEADFVKEFFLANIYNLLCVLGGKRITLYVKPEDDHIRMLCAMLDDTFQIKTSRGERTGYGKSLNVNDRVNEALGCPPFQFEIVTGDCNEVFQAATDDSSDAVSAFRNAVTAAENAVICGMDIGGTDIKVVGAVNGRIKALKEYDWRPSDMTTVDDLIRPIVIIVQAIQAALTLPDSNRGNELRSILLCKDSSENEMTAALEAAGKEFGEFILFNGIGVNFPDVVIRNKIVGGETPKTHGIRNNSPDYEAEFSKLTGLDELLLKYCRPGGVVNIANDGSLAAYAAAVEMAHSDRAGEVVDGVFAHTLGTDLGSGWIDADGIIPQIPLEFYNCVIDLGNYPAREYDALDLRSVRNYTTGIAGSPQKYAGQSGAYRFALERFKNGSIGLYQDLISKGFIEETEHGIFVILSPQDKRKPLLEHLMELADKGESQAEGVFRDIGRFLAAVWRETEFILNPKTKRRVLFGRFIKRRNCFKLLQEGAKEMFNVTLDAGDDSLAFTPLMVDLKADPVFTVAQFGQAVGAAYFAAAKL